MQCPTCSHDNRPTAKFCAACGGALPRSCTSCGADLPATARFCDACGAPVAGASPTRAAPLTRGPSAYTPRHLAEKILTTRSALEGERKQVTILFADVAGFTAMSSRLDPEELHGIMDGCFQRVMEAVHRYEGTVNQFTGDGVMALFGAPVAHEDHAVRAVAAASAIQRSLAGYAAEIRRTRGLEFGMRIGLNSGPVVVGKIGDDLRMDYTAQGETVNLAARLQQAGEPGAVLVSEATRRLAERYFVIEPRGELSLKGIDLPVRAYHVAGERASRSRFDAAVEHGLTPFVGREREIEFLEDCFERAREGRGQAVSLVGDAGTGKSRLAYEMQRRAGDRAARALKADCLPRGEAAPFRVAVEFLRALLRVEPADPEASLMRKVEDGVARIEAELSWAVPYYRHLLALPAPELEAEGLDQAQRKRRTLEAVKALVFRAAQERPLLLLVEDLQWIDKSSEDALRSLVDSLSDHRVLLVCTYRTGYVPPWQDRTFHHRLALEPLSAEEAGRMVEHLLPMPERFPARELVVSRAEGNPYFVEELAGFLRGEAAEAAPKIGVPETIHDLLTSRIDRLAEPLKRTLQRAAVLGREFPLRLLEAITPAGEDAAGAVSELVSLELLHEKDLFPELRLSFTQALIREVAYQELLLRARSELHVRAGRALEALYGDRIDEVLQDLARHFARGGEPAEAVRYLMRAADRAASLFAYDDAETTYREALSLANGDGALAPERAGLLERLGDVAFARGEIQQSLDHWAAALAATPGDVRAADLHRKSAVAHWAAGRTDEALAGLERGLAVLGGDREDLAAARLYQELGRCHFRLGENDEATRWASQALVLGERLNAPDVISHAYNTLGVARARAGGLEGGAAIVEKSLQTALAHGLGALACRAYTNLAVMFTTLDHQRSADYCRDGLALARRIGDQLQQSWLHCAMAGGHCTLSGDYDEGVVAAEAAIELDRRLGQRSHLPIPIIILAQIYQCRGDYARSRERYLEALALAQEIGEPQLLFPCYDGLATLAIENDDEQEADRWLTRSQEVQTAAGWSSESFFVLPFLC